MDDKIVHELATELHDLVSYGAAPHLIIGKPKLVGAMAIPPDTRPQLRGDVMVDTLRRKIEQISTDQQLPRQARTFSARQVQDALKMLLVLTQTAERRRVAWRRVEAAKLLGLIHKNVSSETMLEHPMIEGWRRPRSTEYYLMVILARQIISEQSRESVREFAGTLDSHLDYLADFMKRVDKIPDDPAEQVLTYLDLLEAQKKFRDQQRKDDG